MWRRIFVVQIQTGKHVVDRAGHTDYTRQHEQDYTEYKDSSSGLVGNLRLFYECNVDRI